MEDELEAVDDLELDGFIVLLLDLTHLFWISFIFERLFIYFSMFFFIMVYWINVIMKFDLYSLISFFYIIIIIIFDCWNKLQRREMWKRVDRCNSSYKDVGQTHRCMLD